MAPEPIDSPHFLEFLYHEQGWTLQEIADEFGVSQKTVINRFDEFDIETRNRGKHCRTEHANLGTWRYEMWTSYEDGKQRKVYVHRLLAVAEYGFDKVVNNHVHHKNELKWDNRPDNIELLTSQEHLREHKPHE